MTNSRRLPWPERHAQLLKVARELVKNIGTENFTLARLSERAGVSKPVVYDHFSAKATVFVELYLAFEQAQLRALSDALDVGHRDLASSAELIATAYLDCCVAEGRELGDIVSALAGSPELVAVRQEAQQNYLATSQEALEPFLGEMDTAVMGAVIRAGDALALSILNDEIHPHRARQILTSILIAATSINT